jgi:glycine/D-amino acid oxidase-like deaminating enzyme
MVISSIIRWRSTCHDELWFASGQAHHGVTLGAVTGRLVADVVATGTSSSTRSRSDLADSDRSHA